MRIEHIALVGIMLIWAKVLSHPKREPGVAVNKVRNKRHKRAVKIGFWTNGIAFVLLMCLTYYALSGDQVPNKDVRVAKAVIGSIVFTGWLGLAAYGLTRLTYRLFRGPALPAATLPPPPQIPQGPDFSAME